VTPAPTPSPLFDFARIRLAARGEAPLTGADCFLRAFDWEVRRSAGASHLSQLVLRLGPGFDPEAFRRLLAEVATAQPQLRAPIRRPWGVLPPVYRLDLAARAALPRFEVHEAAPGDGDALPALFHARLNGQLDGARGELLRCDAVLREGGRAGTDLAFTWLHMLFDGSGSERFVRWLDEVGTGKRRASELPAESAPKREAAAPTTLRERGDLAQRWVARMREFAQHAPHSLAGPLTRVPQALDYALLTFTPEQTTAIVARAKKLAGVLTPMLFYLAASIRAHHAVARARGLDPGSYVVPLPVNLRVKGGQGELFGTRISMLWFQVLPSDAEDFDQLLEVLKKQRLAAIKDGYVEAGTAAMDFVRFLPRRAYAAMARRDFKGELCSFFFAYTDEFLPGMQTFLGAPIENAFHAPSVPPSPGSGAIFSLRRGRLNFTHVRQAGVLRAGEREIFEGALRADLLGG
jgi:hypothetical protein